MVDNHRPEITMQVVTNHKPYEDKKSRNDDLQQSKYIYVWEGFSFVKWFSIYKFCWYNNTKIECIKK